MWVNVVFVNKYITYIDSVKKLFITCLPLCVHQYYFSIRSVLRISNTTQFRNRIKITFEVELQARVLVYRIGVAHTHEAWMIWDFTLRLQTYLNPRGTNHPKLYTFLHTNNIIYLHNILLVNFTTPFCFIVGWPVASLSIHCIECKVALVLILLESWEIFHNDTQALFFISPSLSACAWILSLILRFYCPFLSKFWFKDNSTTYKSRQGEERKKEKKRKRRSESVTSSSTIAQCIHRVHKRYMYMQTVECGPHDPCTFIRPCACAR